jgi:hypothetical protein
MSETISSPRSRDIASSPQGQQAARAGLEAFVGSWKTVGQQFPGPVGPAANIAAVETYEWLSRESFLMHRFVGYVGGDEAACIEIIGCDTTNGRHPVLTYYNNGIVNEWELEPAGAGWTLTGGWELAGKSMRVRCSIVFSEDGSRRTGRWEHSNDGSPWQTFWEVTSTRV